MIDVAAARKLYDALREAGRVLLAGPVGPDGDSVGACLALRHVLGRSGGNVDVAGDLDERYLWLPGADQVLPDADVRPIYDAVVVMDGDRHRLTAPVEAAFNAARLRAIVDHHVSARADGYELAWLDHRVASTTEMLYRALPHWGEALDPELALLLYVGAIFDTGGFRYPNTSAETHRMAAELLDCSIDHAEASARILMERSVAGLRLAGQVYAKASFHLDGRLLLARLDRPTQERVGSTPGDLEGIVDGLVFTRGVEVAALLIEREDAVKVSLRSRGRVDVSLVAQELSDTGGGHHNAAGAIVSDALDAVEARVVRLVEARRMVRAS